MTKSTSKRTVKPKINPKLWDCGEWLETFLNSDINSETFRQLAIDAIRILDIEFKLTNDEPSLAHIAKLESIANPELPLWDQWSDLDATIPFENWNDVYPDIAFGITSINAKRESKGKKRKYKSTNEIQTEAIAASLGPLELTRKAITEVFQRVQTTRAAWDKALASILEDESLWFSNDTIRLNLIGGSTQMLTGYGIVKGKLKRIQAFPKTGSDPRDVFNWNTASSKIFFTFMELGGKDYYGFCGHCGKFMLVQRHGQKKFCSDNCRVYNHMKPTPRILPT